MHSTAISLSTSSAVTIYSGFVAPGAKNQKGKLFQLLSRNSTQYKRNISLLHLQCTAWCHPEDAEPTNAKPKVMVWYQCKRGTGYYFIRKVNGKKSHLKHTKRSSPYLISTSKKFLSRNSFTNNLKILYARAI